MNTAQNQTTSKISCEDEGNLKSAIFKIRAVAQSYKGFGEADYLKRIALEIEAFVLLQTTGKETSN